MITVFCVLFVRSVGQQLPQWYTIVYHRMVVGSMTCVEKEFKLVPHKYEECKGFRFRSSVAFFPPVLTFFYCDVIKSFFLFVTFNHRGIVILLTKNKSRVPRRSDEH